MSEDEWVMRDWPNSMLDLLTAQTGGVTERMFRLFGCAACWRIGRLLDEAGHALVEVTERYVLGRATVDEVTAASGAVTQPQVDAKHPRSGARYYAAQAVAQLGWLQTATASKSLFGLVMSASLCDPDSPERLEGYGSGLLRCIFGNPFRPPAAFSANWRTDTVVAIARQMYDTREFSAMPILADALQDAGCDSDDILNHCRGPGPHVRGCWVIDLVLGKE